MKNIVLYFSIIFTCIKVQAAELKIEIVEALKQKIITLKTNGNPKGVHYINPLTQPIVNLTAKEILLIIPSGTLFEPEDSTYQNIIISSVQNISLHVFEKKTVTLNGYCIEPDDSGPTADQNYKLGILNNQQLLAFCAFADSIKTPEITIQHGFWAIASNFDVNEIGGYNSQLIAATQNAVWAIMGNKIKRPVATNSYLTNYSTPPKGINVSAKFEFQFGAPHDVRIVMINSQNIVVRELKNEKAVPAGKHVFTYEFDGDFYTEKSYTMKFIKDNKVAMEYLLTFK